MMVHTTLDNEKGNNNEPLIINVVGQGNHCGLYALALGTQRALASRPWLAARVPDFVREFSEELLIASTLKEMDETTEVTLESFGLALRSKLAITLREDSNYKNKRYENFLAICVQYLLENESISSLSSLPSEMSVLYQSEAAGIFLSTLKEGWKKIQTELNFNESTIETYRSDLKKVTVLEEEISIFKIQLTKLLEKKLRSSEQEQISRIEKIFKYWDERDDNTLYAYIKKHKIYQMAWSEINSENQEVLGSIAEKIRKYLIEDGVRIIKLSKDLDVLINVLKTVSLLAQSNLTQDLRHNKFDQKLLLQTGSSYFAECFLPHEWEKIYSAYCQIVEESPVMLTSEELDVLAVCWGVQLTIDFQDERGRLYQSFSQVNDEALQVTLCNPIDLNTGLRIHWQVVCNRLAQIIQNIDESERGSPQCNELHHIGIASDSKQKEEQKSPLTESASLKRKYVEEKNNDSQEKKQKKQRIQEKKNIEKQSTASPIENKWTYLEKPTVPYESQFIQDLLYNIPNQSGCVCVVFATDTEKDNNGKVFKRRLQQLVRLGNMLERPAIFISRIPEKKNHFILGLIKGEDLILIDPLANIFKQTAFCKLLSKIKKNFLNTIWISYDKILQCKSAMPVSSSPVLLEIAMHLLSELTFVNNFFDELSSAYHRSYKIKNLEYYSISIKSQLLPENLIKLLNINQKAKYQKQIREIRKRHQDVFEKLLIQCVEKSATVEDCLTLRTTSPAHFIVNQLLLGDIVSSPAYRQLQEEMGEHVMSDFADKFSMVFPSIEEESEEKEEEEDEYVNSINCLDLLDLPAPIDIQRQSSKLYQAEYDVNTGIFDGTLIIDPAVGSITRHGVGIYKANDNNEFYSGEWQHDRYEGHGYRRVNRADTYYGLYREGELMEGFGTVRKEMLGGGTCIYEGIIREGKYAGLGTITIILCNKQFKLVAEWDNNLIKKSYLNEINSEYEENFREFFSHLEKWLLDVECLEEQAKQLKYCIKLLEDTLGKNDRYFLQKLSEDAELNDELNKHANGLFEIYRAYHYIDQYIENKIPQPQCREKFVAICLRGISYYRDNLLYEANRKNLDENFNEIKNKIVNYVNSIFESADRHRHDEQKLLNQKKIFLVNPMLIKFILKLSEVLYECKARMPSSKRDSKKENLKNEYFFIESICVDYLTKEKEINLNRSYLDLYAAVYEEYLSYGFLQIFSVRRNLRDGAKNLKDKIFKLLKNYVKNLNKPFELKAICTAILANAISFLPTIIASSQAVSILQMIMRFYENYSVADNANIAYLEELRNVRSIIEYFLYFNPENKLMQNQLEALNNLFCENNQNANRMAIGDLFNCYVEYNKKASLLKDIDALSTTLVPSASEHIRINIASQLSYFSTLIDEIFCLLSKEMPNNAIPLNRLIELMDGMINLDLRWYVDSVNTIIDENNGEARMSETGCPIIPKSWTEICANTIHLRELVWDDDLAPPNIPPHYVLEVIVKLLKLANQKEIIETPKDDEQGKARMAFLDAISSSLTYFSTQTNYTDLANFKKDRLSNFENVVKAKHSLENFKASLARIAIHAVFNTNSMSVENALQRFVKENPDLASDKSKLKRLEAQYHLYEKFFQDYIKDIKAGTSNIHALIKQLREQGEKLKSTFDERERVENPGKNLPTDISKMSSEESQPQKISETASMSAEQRKKECQFFIVKIIAGLSVILSFSASGYLVKEGENESYSLSEEAKGEQTLFVSPYSIQILGVLRLLSCDVENDDITSPPSHLIQILTGQGKSWTLALLGSFFSLCGYNVTVACYSKELTQRDEKDFHHNFGVLNFNKTVRYKTFDELAEEKLTLSSESGAIEIEGRCREIFKKSKIKQYVLKNKKQERPEVLLIDEVDVFFTDKFGSIRNYVVIINNEVIADLQKYIWIKLHKLDGKPQLEDMLSERCNKRLKNAAKEICNGQNDMMKYFKDDKCLPLLYPHINSMIKVVIEIYRSKETPIYTYSLENGYLKIKDPTGFFNENYMPGCGYYNAFYYLLEKYKKHSEFRNDLLSDQYGYLVLHVGSVSYAEIPKVYKGGIFGATGTLRNLLEGERNALFYYGIETLSYCPSFFGSSLLNKPSADAFSVAKETGCLLTATEEQWFVQIAQRAREKIKNEEKAVCVLIFFETEAYLEKFSMIHKGDLGITPYILTEQRKKPVLDRDPLVALDDLVGKDYAGKQGKITLLTKVFGRGIDFKPSAAVNQNGGLHVIQTFFSTDIKEEIQIKGRTARKDYPGSYEQIFCLAHLHQNKFLLNVNILSGSEMRCDENDSIYQQLLIERKNKSEIQVSCLLEKAKTFESVHQASITFFKKAVTCREHTRVAFIQELFANHSENISRQYTFSGHKMVVSRTICLMDATGSMLDLLEKAKETVAIMFDHAYKILRTHHIDPENAFQLQFAVYRNYSSQDRVLEHSEWVNNPEHLKLFLEKIATNGGQGNEAVEVGFWHVNQELAKGPVSQVILIGDMPPNTKEDYQEKRANLNRTSIYNEVKYYEDELKGIVSKNVPIYAYYLKPSAQAVFEAIAKETQGTCQSLNVSSSQGANELTDLVTKQILQDVGNNLAPGDGEKLVEAYNAAYRSPHILQNL